MPRLRYIAENEKTPYARADPIGQAHRRTRSAGGQPDDAQPARHCLGGVLEQAALSGRTYLAKHFSDEEIIELGLFCAEVDGVGKFVKSLDVLSWEEACELNPKLNAAAAQLAAE